MKKICTSLLLLLSATLCPAKRLDGTAQLERNKPAEAIQKYIGHSYTQHNPHVRDGKQGFIEYFEQMAKDYPGKKVTFKKVITEKNFVVLHCLQEWPGNLNYAGIDIFRLDECLNDM